MERTLEIHTDNDFATVPDVAVVTITSQLAAKILALCGIVKSLGTEAYKAVIWNYSPDLFDYDYDSSEEGALKEPDEDTCRVECVTLNVTRDDFFWSGLIKHTSVRWETDSVPIAEIAGLAEKTTTLKTTWDYHQHGPHAFFPVEDWRHDAGSGDTILGYQQWVEHNLESLLYDTSLDGIDAIEVAGCTEADGIVDVQNEENAEFFSVYTHFPNEGVTCIGDFNTKVQAVEFARTLAGRTGIPVYGNLCSIEEVVTEPENETTTTPKSAIELLRHILESFPQADLESEFHDEEIDGGDAVQFLSETVPQIRECLEAIVAQEEDPTLKALIAAWNFIENVTDDDPKRNDKFFALRKLVRNVFWAEWREAETSDTLSVMDSK